MCVCVSIKFAGAFYWIVKWLCSFRTPIGSSSAAWKDDSSISSTFILRLECRLLKHCCSAQIIIIIPMLCSNICYSIVSVLYVC